MRPTIGWITLERKDTGKESRNQYRNIEEWMLKNGERMMENEEERMKRRKRKNPRTTYSGK
ncbi:MAG: hypothetical protein IPI01_14125 [Ignavibacteriae bacterium]|nr:hypothetical protein [Ignavibacteriota bacterium]